MSLLPNQTAHDLLQRHAPPLVFVLYVAAVLLVLPMSRNAAMPLLWWPAAGIGIAAVHLHGARIWLALALAVVVGEWLLYSNLASVLFGSAGTLAGFAIAQWLADRHLQTRQPCTRFRSLGLFLLLFGVAIPLLLEVAHFVALSAATTAASPPTPRQLLSGMLANALGILSIAPLLLVLHQPALSTPHRHPLEYLLAYLSVGAALYLLIFVAAPTHLAIAFGMLLALPLIWSLYRFSAMHPLLILLLDTLALTFASWRGMGPFACASVNVSHVSCGIGLQLYLLVLIPSTLVAVVMVWKASMAQADLKLASTVFENTLEGIVITDSRRVIRSVNNAFLEASGYPKNALIGRPIDDLTSHYLGNEFFVDLFREISRVGRWQGEVWSRRADNSVAPEWLNIKVVRNRDGEPIHYICLYSDIAHQQRIQDQVHRLAYYDVLTNLPNRQLFNDRLELALNQAARRKTRLGVCFLDLDRFKNINDTLGHGVGDEVLKIVAERLNQCVRKTDTLSRLGGDEFTIILSDIQSSGDVALVASKILDALNSPVKAGDHELFLTTSIGVALYPEHGDTPDLLLKHADTAMYRSKDLGGNNYQLFDASMSEPVSQGLAIENALRRAIDDNRIGVAYQAQFRIADNRVLGVEALARWEDADLGTVSPEEFIKIAESTGLIHRLGELILRRACEDVIQWREQGLGDIRVAINISALQLARKGLAELFDDVLDYFKIPATQIELEITESALMENTQQMSDTLERLSLMGFQLAIDDFGTGYSSLSYLKRLPVERLKIDRSFVTDIPDDANDAAIAAAIIAMGHSMNLKVIAEGVETRAQMEFLREHDCDEIQGNLLSMPMNATDIALLIRSLSE